MFTRIAAIVAFMSAQWFRFAVVGRWKGADREALLEGSYLRWAGLVLEKFQARVEVVNPENLPDFSVRPLVLLCNHQSQLDIPALVSVFSERLLFVAKIELSRIPLLAYWMRQVGCIFIDRSNKAAAHRSLEKAAKEMGRHPLVVFPEGTRSKTGELLPIKTGGMRMAALAKATVLPLRLEGTRDALEKRKVWSREPIPVRLTVFPALSPAEGLDEKAAVERMKAYLAECWSQSSPQPQAE